MRRNKSYLECLMFYEWEFQKDRGEKSLAWEIIRIIYLFMYLLGFLLCIQLCFVYLKYSRVLNF